MENGVLWRQRFAEHLQLRGFTERTIEGCLYDLDAFLRFLGGQGVNQVAELQREHVEAYRTHLFHLEKHGQRLSMGTQAGHLSTVKAFCRFLYKDHYLLLDPARDIELPKVPQRLPRFSLSEQEVVAIIEAPNVRTPLGIRDRAIMEVFYSTGIRNTELAHLKIEDVNFARRELAVRAGKGGKSRMVPLGDEAAAWLEEYLQHARPLLVNPASRDLLFVSCHGLRIHRNYMSRIVRTASRQAGLDKAITPHVLRRACATHMLRNGAGVRHIQELLGHASLTTTQRYTQLDLSDLRRVHQSCHPREKGVDA